MVGASYKNYSSYQDFINEVIVGVMQEGYIAIICNYMDYQGIIATLNEKTINGNSLYLNAESAENFDDDIVTAQMNDGNILITIFDTGEIIGEAVVFQTADSFAPMSYFIEYDAKSALEYPLRGTVIPFRISN